MACVMTFHVVMGQSKRGVGAGLPVTLCRGLGAVTVISHLARESSFQEDALLRDVNCLPL